MHLGIDIGTHTARAAYLGEDGRPRLVRFVGGGTALPALARQTMHGLVVGEEAARALVGNAETTVCGCTRLMGRAGNLPARLLERLPFPVREAGGEAVCDLLYAEVRASEVYGSIVRALVEAAERETGRAVERVVLTVPASAEDRFRVQARAAAESQGVRVHRLINQPAAALLALDGPLTEDQRPTTNGQGIVGQESAEVTTVGRRSPVVGRSSRVAVVSCGGGSTEVSVAERVAGGWRVLATAGDALLGGDDFAWSVAARLNERFRDGAGLDVLAVGDSHVAAQGLRAAAEEALLRLSLAPEATLVLDHGGGFGRDLVAAVRRADADAWLTPAMRQVADLCARALAARMPQRTQRSQKETYQADARRSRRRASQPAESSGPAVADHTVGAAVLIGDWAHLPQLQRTVARALGLPLGALHTARAETLAVEGAARAAADDAPTVWDVTPYPLGINCYFADEELFSPIVAANTPIPTPVAGEPGAFCERYWTRFPDQRQVRLDVLQYRGPRDANPYGEGRVRPHECEQLGSWEFGGLSPRPGEHVAFTVTFAVDADGILHLEARETATGHTLSARIDRGIG